ncbi:peptidoglycan-binding protein [Streptomyces buecherae]|uniref:peptidoglycan-binding protein n=1 Tax=Streptomyces buecherae TaxID=2763006 RepID=UPI0037B1CAA4
MGTQWIAGAERLGDGTIGGPMDSPGRPARVVWHTTESGDGNASFNAVERYLRQIGAEPHILYCPATDRIGQFGPLGHSARALRNDGAARTNRTGKACIQIEVLGRAGKPFTGYWEPGPNFRKLMAAIRSWGIPDAFPAGTPAKTASAAKRDRNIWLTKGGHFGHSQVPGNDHWDPGAINTKALFLAAGGTSPEPKPSTYTVKSGDTLSSIGRKTGVSWKVIATLNSLKSPYPLKPGQVLKLKAPSKPPTKPKPPAFPGRQHFKAGAVSAHVTTLGRQLVKRGYGRYYKEGPGPRWTDADRSAVRAFQRAQGWAGADADGYPGPETWRRLFSA